MTSAKKETPKAGHTNYGHLFTGGVAGAISRSATSPLERLRILQQTSAVGYKGLGTVGSLKMMYTKEGMRGFFKGNGATVAKIAPFSAFEFYFYELFKSNLFPGVPKNKLSYMQKLACGGLTGICASTLTYPMDLVKTYLTINQDNNVKITIMDQTKIIYREHGFFGLYKGWGLSMIGIAPFIGIKMSSFDLLSNNFKPSADNKHNMIYYNLMNGALAGTIAVTFTYPVDLTRRLLQLNNTPGHSYTGMVDCCQQLYSKEGFGGFWKGLWATYLKVAPMTAILFLCNEQLKRMINIQ